MGRSYGPEWPRVSCKLNASSLFFSTPNCQESNKIGFMFVDSFLAYLWISVRHWVSQSQTPWSWCRQWHWSVQIYIRWDEDGANNGNSFLRAVNAKQLSHVEAMTLHWQYSLDQYILWRTPWHILTVLGYPCCRQHGRSEGYREWHWLSEADQSK